MKGEKRDNKHNFYSQTLDGSLLDPFLAVAKKALLVRGSREMTPEWTFTG